MKAARFSNLDVLLTDLHYKACSVAMILKVGGLDKAKRLRVARLAMNKARLLLARFRSLFQILELSWYDTCADEFRICPRLTGISRKAGKVASSATTSI